jgi:AcrR family transcriptional regulator
MANPTSQPQEGLRARKKRVLRRKILERASIRFSRKGSAETRIEEIAADLDVSAATVFNYFGSKDAILLEIAKDLIGDFEQALATRSVPEPAQSQSLVLDWQGAQQTLEAAFRDRPTVNRRLCLELMRVALPHKVGRDIVSRIHRALSERIAQGQLSGEIRNDLASGTLAELVADMLTGAFINWLNDPGRPLSERIGQALSFMREALQVRS